METYYVGFRVEDRVVTRRLPIRREGDGYMVLVDDSREFGGRKYHTLSRMTRAEKSLFAEVDWSSNLAEWKRRALAGTGAESGLFGVSAESVGREVSGG